MFKALVCTLVLALALADEYSGPLEPYTVNDCSPGLFIVDNDNMCWYHQCLMISATEYTLLARRCATGTKVPYDYTASLFHPCTYRFTGDSNFECSREQETRVQVPACASELSCENGGTVMYEGSSCWCQCPESWQGDWLCSRPTGAYVGAPEGSSICVDGQPERDWCVEAGGCLNGGTCYNQCDSYWCDCISPFTWSKRCDEFTCADDNECFNGGICRRGDDDNAESRVCLCQEGYYGFQCEQSQK